MATNQPTPAARPWFRFASIRAIPPPAPAPAPPQEPRPPVTRPPFRPIAPTTQPQPRLGAPPPSAPASLPSSPQLRVFGPSSSVPTSPTQQPTFSAYKEEQQSKTSSDPSRSVHSTPAQFPKPVKHTEAPPPTPLTQQPPTLKLNDQTEHKVPPESEPKTVLVQKTIEKPKSWPNGNAKQDRVLPREAETETKVIRKKSSDSEDVRMRFVTVAGENKGALMELVLPHKEHGFGNKPHHLQKINNSGRESEGSGGSNDEVNGKKKDKNIFKGKTANSLGRRVFINSNVQGVNNSLLLNTSCSSHDPGVHIALSEKPHNGGLELKEHHVHGIHD